MSAVRELIRAVRVVGIARMLRLRRAYRLVWPGMITGYCATHVMHTLFNVGFFDELRAKGSINVDAFAEERDLDREILHSLCDTMFALGVLGRDGPCLVLEPKGRLLVDVGRGWFDGVFAYSDLFNSLEGMLTRQLRYRDQLERRPLFVARGTGRAESLVHFPLAVDQIRVQGFRKVLDLGCGDGAFLRYVCHQVPGMLGSGVDLSAEAIREGMTQIHAEHLDDRVELFTGDF